jgi:hypothetical protein
MSNFCVLDEFPSVKESWKSWPTAQEIPSPAVIDGKSLGPYRLCSAEEGSGFPEKP